MRVRFFASDKPRERALARNFAAGARRHRVEVSVEPLSRYPVLNDIDAACMVGVKSAKLFRECERCGVVPIMFDKGYVRDRLPDARVWQFWRVAVGAHHPTRYLSGRKLSAERWQALGLDIEPWRNFADIVLIAGSSEKYHNFYGLEHPTEWARKVVEQLRSMTNKRIVYRPKPSWHDAKPIRGAEFSGPTDKLGPILENAWAVVTHGSNLCFEAALRGVPSIVLGDGVAAPISSTRLAEIANPKLGKREQWLANLAHWQWTEDEMADGLMWKFLEPYVEGLLK